MRLKPANLLEVALHVKAQEFETLAPVKWARQEMWKDDGFEIETVQLLGQVGQNDPQ